MPDGMMVHDGSVYDGSVHGLVHDGTVLTQNSTLSGTYPTPNRPAARNHNATF